MQFCGDAHLSNFGAFASPERTLLFDLNDFDETLPGPFEYDVKRMAASFMIAARNNGFDRSDARAATGASVTAYRTQMARVRRDAHHGRLVRPPVRARAHERDQGHRAASDRAGTEKVGKAAQKLAEKQARKAHSRDSLQALSKLAEQVDGRYRIVSQPPVVIPLRDLAPRIGRSVDELEHVIHEQFRAYRKTLQDDRRHLLEQFEVVDMAHKVVGVGSVGTRAFIVLLQGRDQDDPLFLQVKEATASVLEDHLPKSRYRHPGERVVQGQRLMQAASDIFLGWTKGHEANRYLYWRQLRDMKGSALVETMVSGHAHVLRAGLRSNPGSGARPFRRSGGPGRVPRQEGSVRPSRSPTSPSAMPTRTSVTTRRSPPRSAPADCGGRGRLIADLG